MGLAVSSACSDSNISTPSSKVEGRLPRHAAGRDRSPLASKRRSSPREPSDFRNSESGRRGLLRRERHPYDTSGGSGRGVLAFSPLRYGPSNLLRTGGGSPRSHE